MQWCKSETSLQMAKEKVLGHLKASHFRRKYEFCRSYHSLMSVGRKTIQVLCPLVCLFKIPEVLQLLQLHSKPNEYSSFFLFFFCLQPCWLNYWLGNIIITRQCDVILSLVYILSKDFNKIIFSLNTHQAKHSYHCEVAGMEMTLISCTLSKYQLKWYRFLIIDIICTLVSQNLGVLSLKVCTPEPNRNLSC